MSNVIRPARFAALISSPAMTPSKRRRRMIDGRLVGMAIAAMGLAWILALAGTAFAIRAILVLCFAALAGRTRTNRSIAG
jgi:hypothetical protein